MDAHAESKLQALGLRAAAADRQAKARRRRHRPRHSGARVLGVGAVVLASSEEAIGAPPSPELGSTPRKRSSGRGRALEAIEAGRKKVYEAKVWVKPWLDFKKLQEFVHKGDATTFTSADLGAKKGSRSRLCDLAIAVAAAL